MARVLRGLLRAHRGVHRRRGSRPLARSAGGSRPAQWREGAVGALLGDLPSPRRLGGADRVLPRRTRSPGSRRASGVAMSETNVEIAEQGMDAFNRRDVDAFMEFTTSDFELFPALAG